MIAISYRRDDSLPIAGRLYDRLQAKFGKRNVFMDFDSIPPGVDFRDQIKQTIERSTVLIAVIGPNWQGRRSDASCRIADPNDFVHLEIAFALKHGVAIIPVLLNNTAMPSSEKLPSDIQALAFRHALPLDSGIDFHAHVDRLINSIKRAGSVTAGIREEMIDREIIGEPTRFMKNRDQTRLHGVRSKRKIIIWTGTILLVIASSLLWFERARSPRAPLPVPTNSRTDATRFPWRTNIVTTVFWIGEEYNGKTRNKSVWDTNWLSNYGGLDNPIPTARHDYIPNSFVPRQNPFYCALPYNDVIPGQFKPEAALVIPWFKQAYSEPGRSVCKDRWIAIRKGDRTCYAQWEDCGPFGSDQFKYVFQNERPKPNSNRGAALDVSPAVRDYLGLAPTDVTDWHFVEVRDVAPGPWRNYGDNNHFVIAKRQMEQRLAPKGK